METGRSTWDQGSQPQPKDTMRAMQQQLQALSKQVKALKAQLASKTASQHAATELTTPPSSTVAHVDRQQPQVTPRASKSLPADPQPTARPSIVAASREETHFQIGRERRLCRLAENHYRHSMRGFIGVANRLNELRSPAVVAVASRAHATLQAIMEAARNRQDQKLIRCIKTNYRKPATLDVEIGSSSRSPVDDVAIPSQATVNSGDSTPHTRLVSKDLSGELHECARESVDNTFAGPAVLEGFNGTPRLSRQIHTFHSNLNSSISTKLDPLQATDTTPKTAPEGETSSVLKEDTLSERSASSGQMNARSLIDELFPEAKKSLDHGPTPDDRNQYPKLTLPNNPPLVRPAFSEPPMSLKDQVKTSFQNRGEQITVLQLTNCSTELTEADFLRLVPKGKHIEGWRREGEFFQIIPGRDPLSLSRMPFYYILFRNPESALAYQKNVSRIHKLSRLHGPSNILSAVPAPKGFLEDGEDISSITSSYNLLPTQHDVSLVTLMQPYNPALRALLERGGYHPIATGVDEQGQRIARVLLHIEGYEPTPFDLFKMLMHDAYMQGMPFTIRNESQSAVRRLRDMVNLKSSIKAVSTASPRAYESFDRPTTHMEYEDAGIQAFMAGAEEDLGAKEVSQFMMNRLYNRWILDFEDESAARRFAIRWHRRPLPEVSGGKEWKDSEEPRMCNTEFLW
ncbi:hypothetical protein ACN47E_000958 [Coniothyrium glycines]